MKIATIFICVLLASCSANVDGWDVRTFINKCKEHGGLHHINTIAPTGRCNDGTIVSKNVKSDDE